MKEMSANDVVDVLLNKETIHCGCGLCKFGKKYGLPTIRDMREKSRERILLDDYKIA